MRGLSRRIYLIADYKAVIFIIAPDLPGLFNVQRMKFTFVNTENNHCINSLDSKDILAINSDNPIQDMQRPIAFWRAAELAISLNEDNALKDVSEAVWFFTHSSFIRFQYLRLGFSIKSNELYNHESSLLLIKSFLYKCSYIQNRYGFEIHSHNGKAKIILAVGSPVNPIVYFLATECDMNICKYLNSILFIKTEDKSSPYRAIKTENISINDNIDTLILQVSDLVEIAIARLETGLNRIIDFNNSRGQLDLFV
jgi:hypothetical protein